MGSKSNSEAGCAARQGTVSDANPKLRAAIDRNLAPNMKDPPYFIPLGPRRCGPTCVTSASIWTDVSKCADCGDGPEPISPALGRIGYGIPDTFRNYG